MFHLEVRNKEEKGRERDGAAHPMLIVMMVKAMGRGKGIQSA